VERGNLRGLLVRRGNGDIKKTKESYLKALAHKTFL
jgi:hypothetical protein